MNAANKIVELVKLFPRSPNKIHKDVKDLNDELYYKKIKLSVSLERPPFNITVEKKDFGEFQKNKDKDGLSDIYFSKYLSSGDQSNYFVFDINKDDADLLTDCIVRYVCSGGRDCKRVPLIINMWPELTKAICAKVFVKRSADAD